MAKNCKNNDIIKLNNQKEEKLYMRENCRKCGRIYETIFIMRGTHDKYGSQCDKGGTILIP